MALMRREQKIKTHAYCERHTEGRTKHSLCKIKTISMKFKILRNYFIYDAFDSDARAMILYLGEEPISPSYRHK